MNKSFNGSSYILAPSIEKKIERLLYSFLFYFANCSYILNRCATVSDSLVVTGSP